MNFLKRSKISGIAQNVPRRASQGGRRRRGGKCRCRIPSQTAAGTAVSETATAASSRISPPMTLRISRRTKRRGRVLKRMSDENDEGIVDAIEAKTSLSCSMGALFIYIYIECRRALHLSFPSSSFFRLDLRKLSL